MKVVMICDFYCESLEYQENLLTKYYAKHGHDVVVITSTYNSVFDYYSDNYDNNAPAREYYDGNAKIIKLRNKVKIRAKVFNRLRVYTSISEILEREQPDLIYVHDIMVNMLEAIKYKKLNPNCKMIMDYHADYTNSGKSLFSRKFLHGIIRKWVLDKARPHLNKIFPIVPAGKTFLSELYGVESSEMEILPLGADTDLGQEVKARGGREILRRKLGILPDDIVIFAGGKLTPLKKIDILIEAVKSINDPKLHLIIIGDASLAYKGHKELLLSLAKGQNNIHFLGWLGKEDIYSYLNIADFAVFPASQSIIWQQAISMGLPLIVGIMPGQEVSYLNLYNNIIILQPEQVHCSGLRAIVEKLAYNSQLRKQMSKGAEQVTAELLDWNTLIDKTLRYNYAEGRDKLSYTNHNLPRAKDGKHGIFT